MMPSISPKQHRAMEAASHGKSTLGIPKSVGADFVVADKTKGVPKGVAAPKMGGLINRGKV